MTVRLLSSRATMSDTRTFADSILFEIKFALRTLLRDRSYAAASVVMLRTTLRVRPRFGRLFARDDNATSSASVVLGYQAWSRFFGADPAIVDRVVRFGPGSFEIIGVLPENVDGRSQDRGGRRRRSCHSQHVGSHSRIDALELRPARNTGQRAAKLPAHAARRNADSACCF